MAGQTIAIVEDEIIIADGIRSVLEELGYNVPEHCSDFDEAVFMLHQCKPDLVLLDIYLSKNTSGIDIGRYIRSNFDIPFIFLTANSDAETVKMAKEVRPDAFLVKPFQKEDLYTSIEIALHNFNTRERETIEAETVTIQPNNLDFIFVKDGQCHHKIKLDDILYLASDHVYVTITTTQKKFLVRASLQNYIDKLDGRKFVRIHRSYLVNFDKVEKINNSYVVIDEQQIPLSKNYRDSIMNTYHF